MSKNEPDMRLDHDTYWKLVREIEASPDGPFPDCPMCVVKPVFVEVSRVLGQTTSPDHTVRFLPCGHWIAEERASA
jgi:hypothetical protein